MRYEGWAVWRDEDLLCLFASAATSRDEAIRQFVQWQTHWHGYEPWQAWLQQGYQVVRINLEIENDQP